MELGNAEQLSAFVFVLILCRKTKKKNLPIDWIQTKEGLRKCGQRGLHTLQRKLKVNYKAQIMFCCFSVCPCYLWSLASCCFSFATCFSQQHGGEFSTDKNKHVWMCLNVLRKLKDWSDHLSALLKINNSQWYPRMWMKSTPDKGLFVSELANIQWNQACNQVIQIAFGNICFYWLLWKCLIIEYHVFPARC